MKKICANQWCKQQFEVMDEDLEFYDKVSPVLEGKKYPIPPPTRCPDCRFQRQMIWRREHALKSRTCDSCKKSIISVHTADAPYPVYCLKCWWSGAYDPLVFGREVDLHRSFLDQFFELQRAVPQLAMQNDNGVGSENCEYCQDFAYGKNCYLITGAWKMQDCYYCDANCLGSRHLFDCYGIHFSELVFDSIICQNLYRCISVHHCYTCNDCAFCTDLRRCKDCVGCIGLRNKRFCIFNEQHSEEEYRAKVASFALYSSEGVKRFRKTFDEWILTFPRKCVNQVNCENCIGDDLYNCKDVRGFQFDKAEYCKFIVHGDAPKNCYDVNQTGLCEWCYEGATPDQSYMTHFTVWCWKDKYVLYSDNCHSSDYLFGCIALKRKKYCILNKQYTKDEYERLAGKIIERMMETPLRSHDGSFAGYEWGEYFPMQRSPYCYNETAALEYFPRTKGEVEAIGLKWRDPDPREFKPPTAELPDRIEDVPDSIVNALLACERCKRNYKILAQELLFYRDSSIPVPRECYECRLAERIKRRNPRRLWERTCAKCGKQMLTSFSPDRPEIVYCEACYLKEVY